MTLFESYIDTISYMKSFIKKGKRKKDDWMIFEEFDIGVHSMFHELSLDKLIEEKLISKEEYNLSKAIRAQTVYMMENDIWDADLVTNNKAWEKLFQLSESLILLLESRGVQIQSKESVSGKDVSELQKEFRSRLYLTYAVIFMLTVISPFGLFIWWFLIFNPLALLLIGCATIAFIAYYAFQMIKFNMECNEKGVFRDSKFWKKLILPTIIFLTIEIPLAYFMYGFINSGG